MTFMTTEAHYSISILKFQRRLVLPESQDSENPERDPLRKERNMKLRLI